MAAKRSTTRHLTHKTPAKEHTAHTQEHTVQTELRTEHQSHNPSKTNMIFAVISIIIIVIITLFVLSHTGEQQAQDSAGQAYNLEPQGQEDPEVTHTYFIDEPATEYTEFGE